MAAQPNPKYSMLSTWRSKQTTWGPDHHMLSMLFSPPNGTAERPAPVFNKTDPVPVLRAWTIELWIVLHAAWPMALQYAYWTFAGQNMSPIAIFFLYALAFQFNAIHEVKILQRLGMKYGFLDGDQHGRDDVPDVGVSKSVQTLLWITTIRPLFTMLLDFDKNAAPLPSVWIPVELALYSIILDLFFYIYHRACHEVDVLWQYHRRHHLTKHPNPFLSAYADTEQEVLEIAVIPIMTWGALKLLGCPMGFYDWWICHQFLVFSEAFGHSGLRLFGHAPGVSRLILAPFGCELMIEDHDLHHRKGYRKSHNYGKQTRLWDKLFGTCAPRVELSPENVDWSHRVSLPLF